MSYEQDYKQLIREVLMAELRQTRNAITASTFGKTLDVHELRKGSFPLLTSRKAYPKSVLGELAAFFRGPKTLKDFEKFGCNYWKQWADDDGSIRVDYGNKWIDFAGINQLEMVLRSLAEDPTGRRHVVTGWDPSTLATASLPCCHMMYQFYVDNDGYLDMLWYQRSVDVMIGLPSDVILAAAWTVLFAQLLGYKPGSIKMVFGDTHIYESHFDNAYVYLNKPIFEPPKYSTTDITSYDEFTPSFISIYDYVHCEPLAFEVHS